MNLTPAAVDDVSATSPVSMTTQTVVLEFGRVHHCVLQKVVAARVSDEGNFFFLILFFPDSFFFAPGNVTSPNYPNNYPDNFDRTDKIWVKEGLVVEMQFTAFDVESLDPSCDDDNDYVTIKNGDGTTLMEKTCGSSLPAAVTSTSNRVEIYFHTDDNFSYSGWRLTWRAVSPGA